MAAAKLKTDKSINHARAEFDDVEARMGELAAYVSDVADSLSHDPESLGPLLQSGWPDLAKLTEMRSKWFECRDALIAAWHDLEPASRVLHPLPSFAALDRSLPVL